MYVPHRFPQGLRVFLLSGLLLLGASPAFALPEAQGLQSPQERSFEEKEGPGMTMGAGDAENMFGRLKNRIGQTWNEGNVDLIVPVYTWHNRLTYRDRDRVRRYNEHPWGGGLGLSMFDEDGDSHMLYLIAFKDSWNKWQPYGGYAFLKNWRFGPDDDVRIGAGVTLGITAREQYNYIPFPLPLPMFGIGYKQFSVEAAYIPGPRDTMNVLFTWLRWTFN